MHARCISFLVTCLFILLSSKLGTPLNRSVMIDDILKAGDAMPTFKLHSELTKAEQRYLGVPKRKEFRLDQIQSEIILVEFFNKYCAHCQTFAPVLNELFSDISSDANIRSRVTMLGVGLGNSTKQMRLYRNEQQVPFPLVQDADFSVHNALGKPKAPFTVIFKKRDETSGIVSAAYLGQVVTKDELLSAIKQLLQPDTFVLHDNLAQNAALLNGTPTAELSEASFLALVKNYYRAQQYQIAGIERISLRHVVIYKVRISRHNNQLVRFVEEVYRNTVCDVCHDTHFWYSFDPDGKLIDFVSIYLPKSENEEWDDHDILKMRTRFIGQSAYNQFEFDPDVDAVTSATITSSLIYDTMNKAKLVLQKLSALNKLNK